MTMREFRELANSSGDRVISIYIPTSKQSTDGYQADKIHLKNELKDIVKESDMDVEEVKKLVKPAQDLLDNYDFWKHNSDMLALFLIDGEMEFYRLPVKIEKSRHFIGKKPYLLPLVPELTKDGNFYLLFLDLNRIRLYQGSRNSIKEIELDPEEIAVSFREEEELDEKIEHLQGQGGVGQAGVMYHGHGGGTDEERKVIIQNYFHRMTNMLEPKLNENPLPLYLAGEASLMPLFHEASKYTHLKKGHLPNITGLAERELRQKAWELARKEFEKEWQTRKSDVEFKLSRNLAIVDDNEKLIKASVTGIVDTLWVQSDHPYLWGIYNEEDFSIHLDQGPTGSNHCLIDMAAVKVLESGGKVYLEDPDEMPGDGLIVGTLRYEVQ